MLTTNQVAQALTHMKLKNLSETIDVSVHLLRKMRESDTSVPYIKFKLVSDYLEG